MVWGFDNRQAAVRVASPFWGREMATSNIEIKASDSTSNPYIALAGMMAAGLDGIDNKIDPGEPTQIDPADYTDAERQRRGIRRVPTRLREALGAFKADPLFKGLMPELMWRAYQEVKPVEAFCSTDVSLSPQAILETYADRWAIAIDSRDGHAYYGVAQDQCRKLTHIVGANTFRLLMAAARTLWFIIASEQRGNVVLKWFRPWYRQKMAPSQFDVAWACREVLQEAGIFPIPRVFPAVAKNQPEDDTPRSIAA